ncbi:MAG TPA: FAD-binding protein, partial [Rhizobacter sp.]|nr:FAD-binding protein [Rhizobacter sp.]
MATGIPYETARQRYRVGATPALRNDAGSVDELLKGYHPDHGPNARVALAVGVNRGDACQPALAQLLHATAQIDDVDIAGAQLVSTDVLVVGGGGGGCAAALSAAKAGSRVILATKLRLGDSNTVMAEGGIQAAVGADDSPQRHFEDTLRAGHFSAEPELVAQMAMDGPDVIRWLIRLGMQFDLEDGHSAFGGKLLRKKPGGATAARILSYRDYTGLEMMRVLREAVDLEPNVSVLNRCPVVELLTDDQGRCAGAVLYNLEWRCFVLARARAVVLATGGTGRLHFNSFPTSNPVGATGDGLVVAYRAGARLRELD